MILPRFCSIAAIEGPEMLFELDAGRDSFRQEVREFFARHVTSEMVQRARDTGTYHDAGLYRAVAAQGWIGLNWPVEDGGLGRDALDALVFGEEAHRVGAPLMMLSTTLMVANTIRFAATLEQRSRILRPVLAGDITCCLGYTEPGCGSDVAAAATTAVRDGASWVINGQKVFTTLAHEATHVFLLCRTEFGGPKYHNLTLFLVPLDSPGVTIDLIRTLSGERTNTTFYSGVRVSDELRIGDINGGWSVMREALVHERGGSLGDIPEIVHLSREILRSSSLGGENSLSETQRACVARLATHGEISRLLDLRVRSMIVDGQSPSIEGSIQKLYASTHLVADVSDAMEAFGPQTVIAERIRGSSLSGALEYLYRHSAVTTIYGGTSEIQRSIIAERALGLPRTR
jgi:3-oxocholest-4-en-26-oyl-CoA dehydrogenase alpha subunit